MCYRLRLIYEKLLFYTKYCIHFFFSKQNISQIVYIFIHIIDMISTGDLCYYIFLISQYEKGITLYVVMAILFHFIKLDFPHQ